MRSRQRNVMTTRSQLKLESLERREMLTGNELEPFSYAWVQDVSGPRDVDPVYSYNATGQDINFTEHGVGEYEVEFEGLRAAGIGEGNVQVSAYNHNGICKVRDWGSSTTADDMSARVDCYDPSGNPQHADFVISVIHPQSVAANLTHAINKGYSAYALANGLTLDSFMADDRYSYNSDRPIVITRTGMGEYSVNFEGLDPLRSVAGGGGTVQVSGYGSDASRCSISRWSGDDDFVVDVSCTNPSASPVDAAFTIAVINHPINKTVGYAWIGDRDRTDVFEPTSTYAFNPSGLDITAHKTATGRYDVIFNGLNPSDVAGGYAQATAYGDSRNVCNVERWDSRPDNRVKVECFDSSGTPVDSRFTVIAVPEPSGDRFEPNDTIEIATDLGSGNVSEDDLSVLFCGGAFEFCSVPDYYKWTAQPGDKQLDVAIDFVHANGNLDLRLLNAPGDELASSTSNTDDESVRWIVEPGNSYFIEVFGPSGFTNDYSLEIEVKSTVDLPGDANGDGVVGFPDFAVLAANFGRRDAVYAQGDFNCDGIIGFADFAILAANFGRRL